jgi:hypothetical protein
MPWSFQRLFLKVYPFWKQATVNHQESTSVNNAADATVDHQEAVLTNITNAPTLLTQLMDENLHKVSLPAISAEFENLQIYDVPASQTSSKLPTQPKYNDRLHIIDPQSKKNKLNSIIAFIESLKEFSALQKLQNSPNKKQLTYNFKGSNVPSISIRSYLMRIVKYINRFSFERENEFSPVCAGFVNVLCGLVLLERLTKVAKLELNDWTVHRALIACILVAHKFLLDDYASNKDFALVGGISLKEMNKLESDVCEALQFEVGLEESEFLTMSRRCFTEWNNDN